MAKYIIILPEMYAVGFSMEANLTAEKNVAH